MMARTILACLLALTLAVWPALPQETAPGDKVITNSLGMKLVLIPAGKFLMGSPATEAERADQEVQHEVEITRPFYLGAYEVTQSEWVKVPGKANRSHFQAKNGGGPDHPVESVRWGDVIDYCKKLSALPAEKKAGREYRLPTEAEWEYACRAGSTTPFNFGKSLSATEGNFNGNYPYGGADKGPYLRRTSKVGSYSPNAWGLYDMHGNVAEWCADYYDPEYYKKSPRVDPKGPEKGVMPTGFTHEIKPGPGGFYRVIRGGSWVDEGRGCRSAYRFRAMPHDPYQLIGFRVVCEVKASK